MKKIIKGILVFILCFGIVGCREKGNKKDDENSWYESILSNIEKSDLKISINSNLEYIAIYEGEENDTTTWTRNIWVTFVPEKLVDKFDSPVMDIKYESEYDENGALNEIDEGRVDIMYVGRDAFIKGNLENDASHWEELYPQFKQMINEIGINNNEEFLTFCENVYELEINSSKND